MSDDREAGGWGRGRLRPTGGVGPPRPVCSSKNCVRASGWRSWPAGATLTPGPAVARAGRSWI